MKYSSNEQMTLRIWSNLFHDHHKIKSVEGPMPRILASLESLTNVLQIINTSEDEKSQKYQTNYSQFATCYLQQH